MASGHLLLSCAKRAATTKIDLFAYLWQLPCALCSLILMTLTRRWTAKKAPFRKSVSSAARLKSLFAVKIAVSQIGKALMSASEIHPVIVNFKEFTKFFLCSLYQKAVSWRIRLRFVNMSFSAYPDGSSWWDGSAPVHRQSPYLHHPHAPMPGHRQPAPCRTGE